MSATPTNKSIDLESFLSGIDDFLKIADKNLTDALNARKTAILTNKCDICQEDAIEFRDDISRKEFTISGMCQICQDDIFGYEGD